MPLENKFAYKNMMIQIADLNRADTEASTHCSNQRSNRAMIQSKENSDLTAKTSIATNMALETKECLLSKHTTNITQTLFPPILHQTQTLLCRNNQPTSQNL